MCERARNSLAPDCLLLNLASRSHSSSGLGYSLPSPPKPGETEQQRQSRRLLDRVESVRLAHSHIAHGAGREGRRRLKIVSDRAADRWVHNCGRSGCRGVIGSAGYLSAQRKRAGIGAPGAALRSRRMLSGNTEVPSGDVWAGRLYRSKPTPRFACCSFSYLRQIPSNPCGTE
jgi:hypothetical protein